MLSWLGENLASKGYVVVAPDCGMKYLPREVAFGKMVAMVEGARILRREYEGRA